MNTVYNHPKHERVLNMFLLKTKRIEQGVVFFLISPLVPNVGSGFPDLPGLIVGEDIGL